MNNKNQMPACEAAAAATTNDSLKEPAQSSGETIR